ncbi:hypothetical protein PCE1_003110 [Barthelona sp. PCE]
MRIFLNNPDSFASKALIRHYQKTETKPSFIIKSNDSFRQDSVSISSVISPQNFPEIERAILQCDVLVYDICDQSDDVLQALDIVQRANLKQNKVLISISSVLTWCRTPSADPEDEESFVTEEDARRRRPHPNYRKQHSLEKLIIRASTDLFRTVVVNCGLLYGDEESYLHPMFKASWNIQNIPLYGDGNNPVYTIHVRDAAAIIADAIENETSSPYVLALDESRCTAKDIISTITTIGNVDITPIEQSEVLLSTGVEELTYDARLERGVVGELDFEWHCAEGLVENFAKVKTEFLNAYNLTPLKVCVVGPPGAPIDELSEKLGKYYDLRSLNPYFLLDVDKEIDGIELEDTPENKISVIHETISRPKLLNRGFILENFPLAISELNALLKTKLYKPPKPEKVKSPEEEEDSEIEEEEEEEEEEEDDDGKPPLFVPDFVFMFKLSKEPEIIEFLENKLGDEIPEDFEQKIDRYLALASGIDDEAPVKGAEVKAEGEEEEEEAEENEEVEKNDTFVTLLEEGGCSVIPLDPLMAVDDLVASAVKIIGAPHNYGPSDEERQMAAMQQHQMIANMQQAAVVNTQTAIMQATEVEAKSRAAADERLKALRDKELALIEEKSKPYQEYLSEHIMPTLTKALYELVELRPEDPIQFVAEYLFRESTE